MGYWDFLKSAMLKRILIKIMYTFVRAYLYKALVILNSFRNQLGTKQHSINFKL